MQRMHDREIDEHRTAMEDELRTFKMTIASRKHKMKKEMKDQMNTTMASVEERNKQSEEQSLAMMEAMVKIIANHEKEYRKHYS